VSVQRNEEIHPRCCNEGYPDGPGRASNKEGESWSIIPRPLSESSAICIQSLTTFSQATLSFGSAAFLACRRQYSACSRKRLGSSPLPPRSVMWREGRLVEQVGDRRNDLSRRERLV
jgi:hypothetical protein